MLVKIISTATLIVMAWLTVQMLHTKQSIDVAQVSYHRALADVRAELTQASKQNDSVSADLMVRMDQFSEQQAQLATSANKVNPEVLKNKNRTITRLKEAAALQDAYARLLKADLAAYEKQGSQAAELLTSTKKTIWKTSEKWSKSKDSLRGLMAPIDILAGKWGRGDYSGNTKKIQKVLLDALNAQSQS